MPQKVKTSTTCFVDEEVLSAKGTCVFRGEFAAPKHNKVGLVLLPSSFQTLGLEEGYIDIYKKIGLEDYFRLPPCGVDVQRAYELMTTIDSIGTADLTNKEGEKVVVSINENLIREALHFKEG